LYLTFLRRDIRDSLAHRIRDRGRHSMCCGIRPLRRNPRRDAGGRSSQTRTERYSWARYYHPQLQRFISEDPIGLRGGDTNLYAYVANKPLESRDPLGLRTLFSVAGYNVDVAVSGTLLGVTVANDLEGFGWSNFSPSISLLTLAGASLDVSVAAPPEENLVASVALGASRHTSIGTNVAVDWSSGIPEAKIRGFNLSLGLGIGTLVSGNVPIGPNTPIGRAVRDAMRGDPFANREMLGRSALTISAGPAPQLSGRK